MQSPILSCYFLSSVASQTGLECGDYESLSGEAAESGR